MSQLKYQVDELNKLILAGNTLQAMELYYGYDVEMQENEDPPRKGKLLCLEQEREALQQVTSLQCKLLNQAIDSVAQVVFSEWEFTIVNNNNQQHILREVSVQQWNEGKIIREKFYYKAMVQVV
jgi:hypothetical protein